MSKRWWLVAAGVLLCAAAVPAAWLLLRDGPSAGGIVVAATPPPTPPAALCADCNLLLISIDTLRADRLSLYGYERPTTPRLEELAASSIVFDRFYYSGGGTLESHMTMLTSLYPLVHGVEPQGKRRLPDARVTLAEQLGAAGFATAAFVDDGWLLAKFGFDQGFDVYDDEGGRFAAILPKAHRWLTDHRDERTFLFVHTYDVHSEFRRLPYECPADNHWRYAAPPRPGDFDGCRDGLCASDLLASVNAEIAAGRTSLPEELDEEDIAFVSSLYDGCINYVDARIADLLGAVRALGLFDRTLVVITSDHGEEFGEHGMMLHHQGGYEELARIPLILKLPDGRQSARRVPHLATMVDLMPTMLELLGVAVPAQAQGHSLIPTLEHGPAVRRSAHMYDVLVTESWKYFRGKLLFDLRSDPRERVDLLAARPEVERQQRRTLDRAIAADQKRARAELDAGHTAVTMAPEEEARLRALGYLQ